MTDLLLTEQDAGQSIAPGHEGEWTHRGEQGARGPRDARPYLRLWYPAVPELGMVLQFKYLWSSEYAVGMTEDIGSPRSGHPCMIMGAKLEPYTYRDGTTKERYKVVVAPITRRGYDKDESRALATPREMRENLGMQAETNWLVLDEVNTFWWPTRRLLSFAHGRDGACVYGLADEGFFRQALQKLYDIHMERRLLAIPRL